MTNDQVETALNAACVTFCVDTNILVEFKPLAEIPWREIAPNAEEIRIIIPTKVGEEMDEHKKNTGRLRRRAHEFVKVQRAIEEASDSRFVLLEGNPRVTVEFDPLYRRHELDANLYELDDDDGRVVAEVARFMTDHKGAIFLSDDGKPLRLPRKAGLLCKRPPSSWRREEGADERDKQIEELQRELGAQPQLEVRFDEQVYILETPPVVNCDSCKERFARVVLSVDRKIPEEESIERYGFESPSLFNIPTMHSCRLTESDLQRYEREYSRFEKRVHRWAKNQIQFFTKFGRFVLVKVEVANNGNRAAGRVLVELELDGDFHFLPTSILVNLIHGFLDPPAAPVPSSDLILARPAEPQPKKPHTIYLQDEPDSDGSTRHLEWRCEEFRQGQWFVLLALIRAGQNATGGLVKVRAASATTAKEVKAQAPLKLNGSTKQSRLCAYWDRRIELLPLKYQDAFRLVNGSDCPTKNEASSN